MENERKPISFKAAPRQPQTEQETAALLTSSQREALETLDGSAQDLSDLEDLGCVLSMRDGSLMLTGWGSTTLECCDTL